MVDSGKCTEKKRHGLRNVRQRLFTGHASVHSNDSYVHRHCLLMMGTDEWEKQAAFAIPIEAFIFCETFNSCLNIYEASYQHYSPFPSTRTMFMEFVLKCVKSAFDSDKKKFGWEEA
jgi:hypothetical protein